MLVNQEAQRVLGHRNAALREPAKTVLQQPLPPVATEHYVRPQPKTPHTATSRPCTGRAPTEAARCAC